MPVWAFILALLIGIIFLNYNFIVLITKCRTAFTYVIPIGMIQAITNQQVGLKYALKLSNLDERLTHRHYLALSLS